MMLTLLLALAPQAEPTPPLRTLHADAARVRLEEFRGAQGFPGAQFAWAEPAPATGGAPRVGAVAVGVRERDGTEALRSEDRMLWGSVGKTFVAAVALQLVAEGVFGLDDRVALHLGGQEWYARMPNAAEISVRQLLTHASGIPDHVRKDAFWQAQRAEPDRVWRTEELLAFALDDAPLAPAGERWDYADTNFVLLGYLIEVKTGQPLFDLVRERLLAPLELADTAPSDRRLLPGLTQGHPVMLAEQWGIPPRTLREGKFFMNPRMEHGGGGMYGAPADLARWTMLLHAGEVLAPEWRAERLRGPAVQPGATERYGLGVQIWDSPHGVAAGHGGWFPGYRTETAWFAGLGLAACIVINTDAPREVRNLRHLLVACVKALVETPAD